MSYASQPNSPALYTPTTTYSSATASLPKEVDESAEAEEGTRGGSHIRSASESALSSVFYDSEAVTYSDPQRKPIPLEHFLLKPKYPSVTVEQNN